ncbi:MAG: hypothetical protein KDD50_14760, partial [Bdellovibrionales bacterium]|nr:hypothetical protein [Bdellovibrionales bacterium]
IGGEYKWQSYAPYLQGFAKIELENIAKKAWKNGIKAQVFNAPEILTNSSSIFLGIEVALYPLLGALQKEKESSSLVKDLLARCNKLLKPDYKIESILDLTSEYFKSEIISQRWSDFPGWPQHNGPEQMKLMRETSQKIIDMHITDKELLTSELSEVVFKSCGKAMISCAYDPQQPVWWIGHDIVAKLCD